MLVETDSLQYIPNQNSTNEENDSQRIVNDTIEATDDKQNEVTESTTSFSSIPLTEEEFLKNNSSQDVTDEVKFTESPAQHTATEQNEGSQSAPFFFGVPATATEETPMTDEGSTVEDDEMNEKTEFTESTPQNIVVKEENPSEYVTSDEENLLSSSRYDEVPEILDTADEVKDDVLISKREDGKLLLNLYTLTIFLKQ